MSEAEIDWLAPPPPPKPATRHLAIVDGPLDAPAPKPRAPLPAAKPEPGSVPLDDAWLVGVWTDHPEYGPQLAMLETLSWPELKRRGWPKSDDRVELDLSTISRNLEAEGPSPLPPVMRLWRRLCCTLTLQDVTGIELATAMARIDGAGMLLRQVAAAKGEV